EHVCNAEELALALDVPIYASRITSEALRFPERLPFSRRWLGQPEPARTVGRDVSQCANRRAVARLGLHVIDSPGHCRGHISFYDPRERVLLSGDSYLHEIFTAPNAEV